MAVRFDSCTSHGDVRTELTFLQLFNGSDGLAVGEDGGQLVVPRAQTLPARLGVLVRGHIVGGDMALVR